MISTELYPNRPGYKVPGPSLEAAIAAEPRCVRLRRIIKERLAVQAMTADECAEAMSETPFSIRPRFSELVIWGEIEDTGVRRCNASGRRATVWMVAVEKVQQELFA